MRIQPIHKRRWIQLDQNGMFVGEAVYHVGDCTISYTYTYICNTSSWSGDETRALLSVWGAAEVQSKLDGVARNKSIFQKIASAVAYALFSD